MVVSCDMNLENPTLVYEPGDVISGRIVLSLDERELIKAVALKISGFASTRWEKPIKDRKQKKPKDENKSVCQPKKETLKPREIYTNREDYLSTTNYFMGSDLATSKIVEAGVYHYNFAVRLPLNCPSDFENSFAHIRYELDVFIDYPDYRKSCYSRKIHVSRPFDLRSIVGLNQPLSIEVLEKKSFLKFWQSPLQLQVDVQQTGFVPGETISVHTKVLNFDLLTLTCITYKLNMVTTLIGLLRNKAKVHTTRSNVVKTVDFQCGQNGKVVQRLQKLHIPDTPPTLDITDCRCIQISYEIEVKVSTSTKHRGVTAILPVIIGTISIANSQEAFQPRLTGSASDALAAARSMENLLTAQAEEHDAFAYASAPVDGGTESHGAHNNLAPRTSFREANFMYSSNLKKRRKHSKSMDQLNGFKPKYVYYDTQNTVQQNDGMSVEQAEFGSVVINNEKSRF